MTITVKRITKVAFLVRLAPGASLPEQASLLQDRLAQILDDGAREVVVDISDARGIDLAMLGTLAAATERLERRGGELLVARREPGTDRYTLARLRHDEVAGLHRRMSAS